MQLATSWQVNGDYSTKCYKAQRDVVIPFRTRNMPQLVATYGDLASVPSAADRPYLAWFAGSMRGLGAISRTRLGCGRRPGDRSGRILYQAYAEQKSYVETLAMAKFCLLPRGIKGGSARLSEAIFAGCVPVLLADRNTYPFDDILDYSAFSISISENDIDTVEERLAAIDEQTLAALQTAALKVRELLVYADEPADEWDRRGVLRMALISMAMRTALRWPVEQCNSV